MTGLLEWILGKPPSTKYDIEYYQRQGLTETLGPYNFQGMAIYRMGHGLEPIDWKQILLNQLRAESYIRQLSEFEQFLFDRLALAE